ncbi:hypothetical protein B9K06_26405, partial [Bacillus sp. OG2]
IPDPPIIFSDELETLDLGFEEWINVFLCFPIFKLFKSSLVLLLAIGEFAEDMVVVVVVTVFI